jgi:acyl-CoA reductase-like NAD-dependent aldehyde dehydrogenase
MSTLAIHNPADGEKIATVPVDDSVSVAGKAARARAAQPAWAARPLDERRACIARFREGVVRDLEALAVTMTRETGKPIRMSRNELNGLLGRLDFFVGMVEPVTATETVFDEGGMKERIEHVPLGVVGNI